jgi:hypothetical protein
MEMASLRLSQLLKDYHGGIEFRYALGQFWFVLEWLDQGWIQERTDQLWPSGTTDVSENARRAFLFGMVNSWHYYQGWSRRMLSALVQMFKDCVDDLAKTERIYFYERGLIEPFAQYLSLGWLNGVAEYGENGIFGDLFDSARDEERGEIIRVLCRNYRFADGAVDFEGTREMKLEFWRKRGERISSVLPYGTPSKELTAYSYWPNQLGLSLTEAEPYLEPTIAHLERSFAFEEIENLIRVKGLTETLPAIRLLEKLVERMKVEPEIRWRATSLRNAMDSICKGARASHKTRIRRLAEVMLAEGLLDYRTSIEECGFPAN